MSTLIADTRTVFSREVRPVLNEPFALIITMIQPLFFLALFGPLLIGTDGLGEAGTLQWFVPGLLVMTALFATSTTGFNLVLEIQSGSHDRMLVTPISRSALFFGRAFKEVVPLLGQAVLLVLVTLPFGFDLHPVGAVVGLLVLSVFAIGVGALSCALGMATAEQDFMFWTVQQTLLFPLLLLSGMLLPVDSGPGWIQALSAANPLTYIVDAERVLFDGEVFSATVAYGLVAAVVVAVVGLWVGTRQMRRAAA
jgi:ABC-2 type transport system permease protein